MRIEDDFSNLFSPAGKDLEERKNKISERRLEKVEFDEQYHFRKKEDWLIDLYKRIDNYCNELKAGKIKKTILQTYIRWAYRNKMFCRVFFYQTSLKIYLRILYSELENPPAFVRDYTKIARTTSTEIWLKDKEEYLQNEEAFFAVISSLIEKSFSKVTGARRLGPVKKRSLEPTKPLAEIEPVKPIEIVEPSSINLSVDENGYVSINLKIHKSKKLLLDKILQETILK